MTLDDVAIQYRYTSYVYHHLLSLFLNTNLLHYYFTIQIVDFVSLDRIQTRVCLSANSKFQAILSRDVLQCNHDLHQKNDDSTATEFNI